MFNKTRLRKIIALICTVAILASANVVFSSAETAAHSPFSASCNTRIGLDTFTTDEESISVNDGNTRALWAINTSEETLDGIELEAILNFSSSTRQSMLFIGNTNWYGFQIFSYSLNNIAVEPVFGDGITKMWDESYVITERSDLGVPQVTGTDIKFTFGFEFIHTSADGKTADVTMTVTVANSYSYKFTVLDAPIENLKRKLLLYGADSSGITIKQAYHSLTQADFGISGKTEV